MRHAQGSPSGDRVMPKPQTAMARGTQPGTSAAALAETGGAGALGSRFPGTLTISPPHPSDAWKGRDDRAGTSAWEDERELPGGNLEGAAYTFACVDHRNPRHRGAHRDVLIDSKRPVRQRTQAALTPPAGWPLALCSAGRAAAQQAQW